MRRLRYMAAMAAFLPVAVQAETLSLAYEIRKDKDPIGRETVSIERDGMAESVTVETHTRASVLFLEFRYDHSRREEWRDGKLVSMVGDTDDDGSKTHLDARASDRGWVLAVNGSQSQRSGDALPLTLWGRAVLSRQELFSIIDAKPYHVTITPRGPETLTLAGKEMASEHFRMSGDVERELWYGSDGLLLRATFERAGFPIEIVRVVP